MNPINSEKQEQIKRVIERVMGTFSANYLRAFKYVVIRDAKGKRMKKEEEDSSAEEPKVLPSTPSDPHRPRGKSKYSKEIVPELQAKITTWETLDSDVDPYVSYIVKASIGDLSASVYRRYNDFKKLNQKLGTKVPEAKKLFPAAKAFEGRSFDHNYISNRKEKLQSFLDTILTNKDVHTDDFLIDWLGLREPEDKKFAEIFDIAFTNTKWRLWIWKRIPYDTEEQALSKLVIEEIKREIWGDIVAGLPNQAKFRQYAIQGAYKTISATVGPAVEAAWKAAKASIDPLKAKVKDIVDNNVDQLLDVEDQIKKKLADQIVKALEPIIEQLEPVLRKLTEKFTEPILSIAQEVSPVKNEVLQKFDAIVETGNAKITEEIGELVKTRRREVEEKVNTMLQRSVEGAIGDLSALVTIEALGELFSPLKRLVEVVNTTFELIFDPTPHLRCIERMCQYRQKLEGLDISAGTEQVEDLLDAEESWLLWDRWWTYWDYRYKAWSLYYHTWGISELASVSLVVRTSAFDFAVLQKKWIKKWSFRFGDHLHERAKTATPQNWQETVRECFAQGFKEANEYFKKRAFAILREFVLSFFFAAIGVKVEEFVMRGLKPVIEPLSKAIPPPVSEILEIDNIARESINKALKDSITEIVQRSMMTPFLDAFANVKL